MLRPCFSMRSLSSFATTAVILAASSSLSSPASVPSGLWLAQSSCTTWPRSLNKESICGCTQGSCTNASQTVPTPNAHAVMSVHMRSCSHALMSLHMLSCHTTVPTSGCRTVPKTVPETFPAQRPSEIPEIAENNKAANAKFPLDLIILTLARACSWLLCS